MIVPFSCSSQGCQSHTRLAYVTDPIKSMLLLRKSVRIISTQIIFLQFLEQNDPQPTTLDLPQIALKALGDRKTWE